MKKITLLLFTFITTFLVGQDKLTSNLSEYFDGTSWVNNGRSEFTYDNSRNLTEEIELYWDSSSSQWVKYYVTKYSYNSNNKATSETYENYDSNGNITTEQDRTIYTYNSNGNLTQILEEEYENSNWVNEGKIDLTYTNNRLSSALGYEWNGTAWVFGVDDSFRLTISYYANGKVSLSESDSWNGTDWIDSDRTVYTYDANNRMIIDDGQTWDGTNWISDYKNEYTYDANGNTITQIESYLDNGVFTAQPIETITFDTSQSMSNFSHPFRDKTGLDVIFPSNVIVNKILGKSSTNYRKTFNYGEATASTNDFNLAYFSVYPNPISSILNIYDSNFSLKSVEIFNTIGKKVLTSKKNTINIENLSKGIYLIKIETETGKFATKRIVKN